NAGLRASASQWIAVLNNDVQLAPDYLAMLRRAAIATNSWFATGKIFAAGQNMILDGTFDVVSRGATAWRAGHGQADRPLFQQRRTIFCAPWTAALFRRELFERAGYLDESFGSYLEDVEFGIRCVLQDCAGMYVPEAVAWHQGSGTLGRWHPSVVR